MLLFFICLRSCKNPNQNFTLSILNNGTYKYFQTIQLFRQIENVFLFFIFLDHTKNAHLNSPQNMFKNSSHMYFKTVYIFGNVYFQVYGFCDELVY